MNIRRLIWFSLTALVVITFLSVIPLDVYHKHPMLYSFLGAVLFFACLFLALGNYESFYDLTDKNPEGPEDSLRKAAPFAVIPAIIMIFVFLMTHSSRVSDELKKNGILTKGVVTGGQSESSTRRGNTTTTYDIYVTYSDSSKHEYSAELDVDRSEFNDLYEGAVIDLVYSSEYPSVSKAVLNLQKLSEYKDIAMGDVGAEHMIAILEGKVKPDSMISYLNSVCYEWREHEDGGYYINDQKSIAVAVALENNKVIYIREISAIAIDTEKKFEKSAETYGFKKREMNDGEKTVTEYYTDNYLITKERKTVDNQSTDFLNQKALDVYSVIKVK